MRAPVLSKIDAFVRQCEALSLAFNWDFIGGLHDAIHEQLNAALVTHFATNRLALAIPGLAPNATVNNTPPWIMYMSSQAARVEHLGSLLHVANQVSMEDIQNRTLQGWAKRYPALSGSNNSRKIVFVGASCLTITPMSESNNIMKDLDNISLLALTWASRITIVWRCECGTCFLIPILMRSRLNPHASSRVRCNI